MRKDDIPLGLGMALAQNETAMKRFAAMNDYQRQSVIQWAHGVKSKQEMQQLVDNIAGNAQG